MTRDWTQEYFGINENTPVSDAESSLKKEKTSRRGKKRWLISKLKTGIGVLAYYKPSNQERPYVVFKVKDGLKSSVFLVEADREEKDYFWHLSPRTLLPYGKLSKIDLYLRKTFKPSKEMLEQALENWNQSKHHMEDLVGGIFLGKEKKDGK